jgi:signal peptidase II
MASGASRPAFWATALGIIVADFATKLIAVAQLTRLPVPIGGEWLTLRLVYNPGAAFGIYAGHYSRQIFMGLALIALGVLLTMVKQTKPDQWFRLTALGLVCGGAVGNLIDRVRSARGVVDFIDVGIGAYRWPTFNVADMAVTCGAVALAIVLWQEGHVASGEAVADPAPPPATSEGAAELSSEH